MGPGEGALWTPGIEVAFSTELPHPGDVMEVAQQASDVLVGGDGLPVSPHVAIAIAARERNVAHRVAEDVPVTAIDGYDVPVPVGGCLLGRAPGFPSEFHEVDPAGLS